MKTPDEFAKLMSDKNPSLGKRPEGSFTLAPRDGKPDLTTFEKVWCALPIAAVITGGALGGALGAVAVACNLGIFRSKRSRAEKYILSSVVLIGTFIAWAIVSTLLIYVLGLHKR